MFQQEVKKALQNNRPIPPTGFEERSDMQLLRLTAEEKNGRRFPRAAIIIWSVLLMLGIATALAATSESINARLYELWPEAARALMPVQLSCVDKGIQLEIISAVNRESDLLVTYSLEDLEGDRINQHTDSYLILEPELPSYLANGHAIACDYDEKTHRMIYAQHEHYDTVLNNNGEIHVKLYNLWPVESTSVDLHPYAELLKQQARTTSVPLNFTLSGPCAEEALSDTRKILDYNTSLEIPLYESVFLSGMGMIDGNLHIQIHFSDCHPIEYLPGCFFNPYTIRITLRDEHRNMLYTGDLTEEIVNILNWGGDLELGVPEWTEFFFAADPVKVKKAEFKIEIIKNLAPIQGKWELSIPLRMIQNK